MRPVHHRRACAFELASDALSPVGGMGRVDFHDPCDQFLLIERVLVAAGVRSDPCVVLAVVGHQDLT